MHVHVLGLGPIGTLVAHHIRRALPIDHTVTLIHKTAERAFQVQNDHAGRLLMETNGVAVPSTGFTHDYFRPTHPMSREERRQFFHAQRNRAKIQTLVVCVKAHQTLQAVGSLYSRITPYTTIVLMQNGMGTMEYLNEKLFTKTQYRPNFVLTTNTHGAYLKEYGHVVHAGIGELDFGVVQPEYNPGKDKVDFERSYREKGELSVDDIARESEALRAALEVGRAEGSLEELEERSRRFKSLKMTVELLMRLKGLNATWRPMNELQMMMQRKLVVNSVINPLTALMGCRNGELFRHNETKRIALKVCDEASSVFLRQHEMDLQRAKFEGEDIGFKPFPRLLTSHGLLQECRRVAEATRNNYSSMLMDMKNGRETEIHSLNGYLIGLGKGYQLPTPVNKALLDLVKLKASISSATTPSHSSNTKRS